MKRLLLIPILLYSASIIAEVQTKSYEKGGVSYELQLNVDTRSAVECLDRCAETCLGTTNSEDRTRLLELENKVLEAKSISKDCETYKGHTKTKCEEKLDKQIKRILEIK